jgi:nicotinamidase-related amidase
LVHIHTHYSADKSDWPRAWSHREQIWCMHGTKGVEVIESLAPLPGEPVIVKKRFSAFHDTQLDGLLRASGIDGLLLCGYSSDVCVRFTAVDAYNRNYNVTLLSDCTAPEKEDPEESMRYLKRFINARIITLEGFENESPSS